MFSVPLTNAGLIDRRVQLLRIYSDYADYAARINRKRRTLHNIIQVLRTNENS